MFWGFFNRKVVKRESSIRRMEDGSYEVDGVTVIPTKVESTLKAGRFLYYLKTKDGDMVVQFDPKDKVQREKLAKL